MHDLAAIIILSITYWCAENKSYFFRASSQIPAPPLLRLRRSSIYIYLYEFASFRFKCGTKPSHQFQNLNSQKIYFIRCIIIIYSLIWFQISLLLLYFVGFSEGGLSISFDFIIMITVILDDILLFPIFLLLLVSIQIVQYSI